jgi:hypothetical protein
MSSRIEYLTKQHCSRESASAGDGPATPALASVIDPRPPAWANAKSRVQLGPGSGHGRILPAPRASVRGGMSADRRIGHGRCGSHGGAVSRADPSVTNTKT